MFSNPSQRTSHVRYWGCWGERDARHAHQFFMVPVGRNMRESGYKACLWALTHEQIQSAMATQESLITQTEVPRRWMRSGISIEERRCHLGPAGQDLLRRYQSVVLEDNYRHFVEILFHWDENIAFRIHFPTSLWGAFYKGWHVVILLVAFFFFAGWNVKACCVWLYTESEIWEVEMLVVQGQGVKESVRWEDSKRVRLWGQTGWDRP